MNTPKSIKPWDLSRDSKLPKKGDKVRVIPELYRKSREKHYKMMRMAGLPENHPSVIEMKATDELLRRVETGEVAIITRADNSRSEHGWADLKFEDGFVSGASFGMISKVG